MDLRPKIAADIVDAILTDLSAIVGTDPSHMGKVRKVWVEMALSKMKSRSLEFPDEDWISTSDPIVVEAFLSKYPMLRELLDLCERKALESWPEARFVREVRNDPEGCHSCSEGQHLGLKVLVKSYEDPLAEAFREWWAFVPKRDGDFTDLLIVTLECEEDEEEGYPSG